MRNNERESDLLCDYCGADDAAVQQLLFGFAFIHAARLDSLCRVHPFLPSHSTSQNVEY